MLEKSLGNGIVRDDTRLERTNRDHISGSALNELPGLLKGSNLRLVDTFRFEN